MNTNRFLKIKKSSISDIQGMTDWRYRHARSFKAISVILIFAFLIYDVTWAQGGTPVWSNARTQVDSDSKIKLNGIAIPSSAGQAQEINSVDSENVILNIQDAHDSLSAQQSIVSILEDLSSNYHIKTIGIEGSIGPMNTALFKAFPDNEVRKDAATYMMEKGKMSAGEFFSIVSEQDIKLYGIDDERLYQENVDSFSRIIDKSLLCIENTEKLIETLKKLEPYVYSKDMALFAANRDKHIKGDLSFKDYWDVLRQICDKNNVSFHEQANIAKLRTAIGLEKEIDFHKANVERKMLIDELSKALPKNELEKLVLQSLSYKMGKTAQSDFHLYLVELAEAYKLNPEPYANIIKFTKYVLSYEDIDITSLFDELDTLEESIAKSLSGSKNALDMYYYKKSLTILKKLFQVNLTQSDMDFLNSRKEFVNRSNIVKFLKENISRFSTSAQGTYDLDMIYDEIPNALEFYKIAEMRNNALLENTIQAMRVSGDHVAAMITGGYHSKGLASLMKSKKLSYMIIMPKFDGDAKNKRPYVTVLTNKIEPYEALLESGKYMLAVRGYTNTGDLNKLKDGIAGLLALADMKGVLNWETRKQFYLKYRDLVTSPDFENRFNKWNGDKVKPMDPLILAKILGLDSNGEKVEKSDGYDTVRVQVGDDDFVIIRKYDMGNITFEVAYIRGTDGRLHLGFVPTEAKAKLDKKQRNVIRSRTYRALNKETNLLLEGKTESYRIIIETAVQSVKDKNGDLKDPVSMRNAFIQAARAKGFVIPKEYEKEVSRFAYVVSDMLSRTKTLVTPGDIKVLPSPVLLDRPEAERAFAPKRTVGKDIKEKVERILMRLNPKEEPPELVLLKADKLMDVIDYLRKLRIKDIESGAPSRELKEYFDTDNWLKFLDRKVRDRNIEDLLGNFLNTRLGTTIDDLENILRSSTVFMEGVIYINSRSYEPYTNKLRKEVELLDLPHEIFHYMIANSQLGTVSADSVELATIYLTILYISSQPELLAAIKDRKLFSELLESGEISPELKSHLEYYIAFMEKLKVNDFRDVLSELSPAGFETIAQLQASFDPRFERTFSKLSIEERKRTFSEAIKIVNSQKEIMSPLTALNNTGTNNKTYLANPLLYGRKVLWIDSKGIPIYDRKNLGLLSMGEERLKVEVTKLLARGVEPQTITASGTNAVKRETVAAKIPETKIDEEEKVSAKKITEPAKKTILIKDMPALIPKLSLKELQVLRDKIDLKLSKYENQSHEINTKLIPNATSQSQVRKYLRWDSFLQKIINSYSTVLLLIDARIEELEKTKAEKKKETTENAVTTLKAPEEKISILNRALNWVSKNALSWKVRTVFFALFAGGSILLTGYFVLAGTKQPAQTQASTTTGTGIPNVPGNTKTTTMAPRPENAVAPAAPPIKKKKEKVDPKIAKLQDEVVFLRMSLEPGKNMEEIVNEVSEITVEQALLNMRDELKKKVVQSKKRELPEAPGVPKPAQPVGKPVVLQPAAPLQQPAIVVPGRLSGRDIAQEDLDILVSALKEKAGSTAEFLSSDRGRNFLARHCESRGLKKGGPGISDHIKGIASYAKLVLSNKTQWHPFLGSPVNTLLANADKEKIPEIERTQLGIMMILQGKIEYDRAYLKLNVSAAKRAVKEDFESFMRLSKLSGQNAQVFWQTHVSRIVEEATVDFTGWDQLDNFMISVMPASLIGAWQVNMLNENGQAIGAPNKDNLFGQVRRNQFISGIPPRANKKTIEMIQRRNLDTQMSINDDFESTKRFIAFARQFGITIDQLKNMENLIKDLEKDLDMQLGDVDNIKIGQLANTIDGMGLRNELIKTFGQRADILLDMISRGNNDAELELQRLLSNLNAPQDGIVDGAWAHRNILREVLLTKRRIYFSRLLTELASVIKDMHFDKTLEEALLTNPNLAKDLNQLLPRLRKILESMKENKIFGKQFYAYGKTPQDYALEYLGQRIMPERGADGKLTGRMFHYADDWETVIKITETKLVDRVSYQVTTNTDKYPVPEDRGMSFWSKFDKIKGWLIVRKEMDILDPINKNVLKHRVIEFLEHDDKGRPTIEQTIENKDGVPTPIERWKIQYQNDGSSTKIKLTIPPKEANRVKRQYDFAQSTAQPFIMLGKIPMPIGWLLGALPEGEAVKRTEYKNESGVRLYPKKYQEAVGGSEGISVNQDEIENILKAIANKTASIWLTIGSKDNSGVVYTLRNVDGKVMYKFRNDEQAINDVVTLIKIAARPDINVRLVLTLHNHDIVGRPYFKAAAEQHRFLLNDDKKMDAMKNLMEFLLNSVKERLTEEEWGHVSAIEAMNESDILLKDATDIDIKQIVRFQEIYALMAREVLKKPFSISLWTATNIKHFAHILKPGDIVQVHWYDHGNRLADLEGEDLEEGIQKQISTLWADIKNSGIPEGVKIVLGEAQPNVGTKSIVKEVISAAYKTGYAGVWFWVDNKEGYNSEVNEKKGIKYFVNFTQMASELNTFTGEETKKPEIQDKGPMPQVRPPSITPPAASKGIIVQNVADLGKLRLELENAVRNYKPGDNIRPPEILITDPQAIRLNSRGLPYERIDDIVYSNGDVVKNVVITIAYGYNGSGMPIFRFEKVGDSDSWYVFSIDTKREKTGYRIVESNTKFIGIRTGVVVKKETDGKTLRVDTENTGVSSASIGILDEYEYKLVDNNIYKTLVIKTPNQNVPGTFKITRVPVAQLESSNITFKADGTVVIDGPERIMYKFGKRDTKNVVEHGPFSPEVIAHRADPAKGVPEGTIFASVTPESDPVMQLAGIYVNNKGQVINLPGEKPKVVYYIAKVGKWYFKQFGPAAPEALADPQKIGAVFVSPSKTAKATMQVSNVYIDVNGVPHLNESEDGKEQPLKLHYLFGTSGILDVKCLGPDAVELEKGDSTAHAGDAYASRNSAGKPEMKVTGIIVNENGDVEGTPEILEMFKWEPNRVIKTIKSTGDVYVYTLGWMLLEVQKDDRTFRSAYDNIDNPTLRYLQEVNSPFTYVYKLGKKPDGSIDESENKTYAIEVRTGVTLDENYVVLNQGELYAKIGYLGDYHYTQYVNAVNVPSSLKGVTFKAHTNSNDVPIAQLSSDNISINDNAEVTIKGAEKVVIRYRYDRDYTLQYSTVEKADPANNEYYVSNFSRTRGGEPAKEQISGLMEVDKEGYVVVPGKTLKYFIRVDSEGEVFLLTVPSTTRDGAREKFFGKNIDNPGILYKAEATWDDITKSLKDVVLLEKFKETDIKEQGRVAKRHTVIKEYGTMKKDVYGISQILADKTPREVLSYLETILSNHWDADHIVGWIKLDIKTLGSKEPTPDFIELHKDETKDFINQKWSEEQNALPYIIRAKLMAYYTLIMSRGTLSEDEQNKYYSTISSILNIAEWYGVTVPGLEQLAPSGQNRVPMNAFYFSNDNLPMGFDPESDLNGIVIDSIKPDDNLNPSSLSFMVDIEAGAEKSRCAYLYLPVQVAVPSLVGPDGTADLNGKEIVFKMQVPREFLSANDQARNGLEASMKYLDENGATHRQEGYWCNIARPGKNDVMSDGYNILIEEGNRKNNHDNWVTVRMRPEKRPGFDPKKIKRFTHVGFRISLAPAKNVEKVKAEFKVKDAAIQDAPSIVDRTHFEQVRKNLFELPIKIQDEPKNYRPTVVYHLEPTQLDVDSDYARLVLALRYADPTFILGKHEDPDLIDSFYTRLKEFNVQTGDEARLENIVKYAITIKQLINKLSGIKASPDRSAMDSIMYWAVQLEKGNMGKICSKMSKTNGVAKVVPLLMRLYKLQRFDGELVDRIYSIIYNQSVKVLIGNTTNTSPFTIENAEEQIDTLINVRGEEYVLTPSEILETNKLFYIGAYILLILSLGLLRPLYNRLIKRASAAVTPDGTATEPDAEGDDDEIYDPTKVTYNAAPAVKALTDIAYSYCGGAKATNDPPKRTTISKAIDVLEKINIPKIGKYGRLMLAVGVTIIVAYLYCVGSAYMNFGLNYEFKDYLIRNISYRAGLMLVITSILSNLSWVNYILFKKASEKEMIYAKAQVDSMDIILKALDDIETKVRDLLASSTQVDAKRIKQVIHNIPARVAFPKIDEWIDETYQYRDMFDTINIARIEANFLKNEANRVIDEISNGNDKARLVYKVRVKSVGLYKILEVKGPGYRKIKAREEDHLDNPDQSGYSGGYVLGAFGTDAMPGSEAYLDRLTTNDDGTIREYPGDKKYQANELFAHKVGYDLILSKHCIDVEKLDSQPSLEEGIRNRAARIDMSGKSEQTLGALAARATMRSRYELPILISGLLWGAIIGGIFYSLPFLPDAIYLPATNLFLTLNKSMNLGNFLFSLTLSGGIAFMLLVQFAKPWLLMNGQFWKDVRRFLTKDEAVEMMNIRLKALKRQAIALGISDLSGTATDLTERIKEKLPEATPEELKALRAEARASGVMKPARTAPELRQQIREKETESGVEDGKTIQDYAYFMTNAVKQLDLIKSIFDLHVMPDYVKVRNLWPDKNLYLTDEVKIAISKDIKAGKIPLRKETLKMLRSILSGRAEGAILADDVLPNARIDNSQIDNSIIIQRLSEILTDDEMILVGRRLASLMLIARPSPGRLPLALRVIDNVYQHANVKGQFPIDRTYARFDSNIMSPDAPQIAETIINHPHLKGRAWGSFEPVPEGNAMGEQNQPVGKPSANNFGGYDTIQLFLRLGIPLPEAWEILDEDNEPQRFHYWTVSVGYNRIKTVVSYLIEEMRDEDGKFTPSHILPHNLIKKNPELYKEAIRWNIDLFAAEKIAGEYNDYMKKLIELSSEPNDPQYELLNQIFGPGGIYRDIDHYIESEMAAREGPTVMQGNPIQLPYGLNRFFHMDYNGWGPIKFGLLAPRHLITVFTTALGAGMGLIAALTAHITPYIITDIFFGVLLVVTGLFGGFLAGSNFIKLARERGWSWVMMGQSTHTLFHLDGLSNWFDTASMYGYTVDGKETERKKVETLLRIYTRLANKTDDIGLTRLITNLTFLQPLGVHPADDTTEDKHLGTRTSARKLRVYYYTDMGASVLEDAGPKHFAWISQRSRWIMVVSTGTVFAANFLLLAPFYGTVMAGLMGALFGPTNHIAVAFGGLALGFIVGTILGKITGSIIMAILIRNHVLKGPEHLADRVKQVGWSNVFIAILLDSGFTSSIFTLFSFKVTKYYMFSLLLSVGLYKYQFITDWDGTGFSYIFRNFAEFVNTWLPYDLWFIPLVTVGVGMLLTFYFYQVFHNLYCLYFNKLGGVEKIKKGYDYYRERIEEYENDKNVISGTLTGKIIQSSVSQWNNAVKMLEKAVSGVVTGRADTDVVSKDDIRKIGEKLKIDLLVESKKDESFPEHMAYFMRTFLNDFASRSNEIYVGEFKSKPAEEIRKLIIESIDKRIEMLRDEKSYYEEGKYQPGILTFLLGLGLTTFGYFYLYTTASALITMGIGLFLMAAFSVFKILDIYVKVGPVAYYYIYHSKLAFLMPFYYVPIIDSMELVAEQIFSRQDNKWPYTEKALPISLNRLVEKTYYEKTSGTGVFLHAIGELKDDFKRYWRANGYRHLETYGAAFFTIIGICFAYPNYDLIIYLNKSLNKAAPLMETFEKSYFESPFYNPAAVEPIKNAFSFMPYIWIIGVGAMATLALVLYVAYKYQHSKEEIEFAARKDIAKRMASISQERESRAGKSNIELIIAASGVAAIFMGLTYDTTKLLIGLGTMVSLLLGAVIVSMILKVVGPRSQYTVEGAHKDIIIAVPKTMSLRDQADITLAIENIKPRFSEKIELIFFDDQFDDAANTEFANKVAEQYNAAMVIPVRRNITAKSFINEVGAGFIDNVVIDLFKLVNPDIAKLDSTSLKIKAMTKADLETLETKLNTLLPSVVSNGLASSSLNMMNLRLRNVARRASLNHPLSNNAVSMLQDTKTARIVGASVEGLGGLKIFIEDLLARQRSNKGIYPARTKIWITAKSTLEKTNIESKLSDYLAKMNIPGDILSPQDVSVITQDAEARDMFNALTQSGYKPENIVLVTRFNKSRKPDNELFTQVRFMQYEDIVTPGIYDAAIELLAHDINDKQIPGIEIRNGWFIFIPRISRADIEQIKREILRYEVVLTAA